MSDEALDPRHQLLIGALYGELSRDDEDRFQSMLRQDVELRSEWDELRGTRELLQGWPEEQEMPAFVIPERELVLPGGAGTSGWDRFLEGFQRLLGTPTWGLAASTAAVGLLVLILAGFRVDRVENGLAFRFGSPDGGAVATNGSTFEPPAVLPQGSDPGVRALPVSDTGNLGTSGRESYALLGLVSTMLEDYEQRRNGELAYILQNFYQEISMQQRREYESLLSEIQGVGLGLMGRQGSTDARIQNLMDALGQTEVEVREDSPPQRPEE